MSAAESAPVSASRLHVDTDCGVDDALALMLLVRAGAPVVSVSAVFGNTYVDQAAANARGVLRLSGCPADIYIGAGHGLARRTVERMRPAHGVDGLNGSGMTQRWTLPMLLGGQHGVSHLTHAARRGVQGLFLGPVTNLANASIDDPAAFHNWSPLVTAGAMTVKGLAPGGTDFNSWSDPEALSRVLGAGVMPRLVPMDISSQITLTRQALAEGVQAAATPLHRRLAPGVLAYMDFHGPRWNIDGCHPHDAVTAAAWLWPELFTFEPVRLQVTGGEGEGRGRIERIEGAPNAWLCTRVDAPTVQGRILAVLFAPPPPVQDANA